ncbi:hypothetical protein D9757_013625 [Collybiopsis confluens]|uniref:Knr4/Smi1-like domain-containing protein n=1 Tax=Collybiopsis confluens TaxID=2823264 RepID=A0A8H5FVD0_9AGAR|nr:hypothetical protein D9757_013625 [Collybiopsis confluens]
MSSSRSGTSGKMDRNGIGICSAYICIGVSHLACVEIIANDQGNRTTPSQNASIPPPLSLIPGDQLTNDIRTSAPTASDCEGPSDDYKRGESDADMGTYTKGSTSKSKAVRIVSYFTRMKRAHLYESRSRLRVYKLDQHQTRTPSPPTAMNWFSSLFSQGFSQNSRRGQAMKSTHEAFSISTSSPVFSSDSDAYTPGVLNTPDTARSGSYTYPPPSPASYSYVPTFPNSRQNSLLPTHHDQFHTPIPPRSAYPPLPQTWNRFRAWLARQYPALGDTLNYGILPQDLAQIEAQFGFPLPAVVRESYLAVDGQEAESAAGCSEGLFFGLFLLPLEDVLDEWRFWREVDDEPSTGANVQLRDAMQSIPPNWIRREYSQRGWIPLIADKTGNYVGVDLVLTDADDVEAAELLPDSEATPTTDTYPVFGTRKAPPNLPIISITKPPVPLPVELPTPRDIVALPSLPDSRHSSFDLESNRTGALSQEATSPSHRSSPDVSRSSGVISPPSPLQMTSWLIRILSWRLEVIRPRFISNLKPTQNASIPPPLSLIPVQCALC